MAIEDIKVEIVQKVVAEHRTVRSVALEYNLSEQLLYRKLKEWKVKKPKILVLDKVKDEVIAKYKQGVSQYKLAIEYGVSDSCMSYTLDKWGVQKRKDTCLECESVEYGVLTDEQMEQEMETIIYR